MSKSTVDLIRKNGPTSMGSPIPASMTAEDEKAARADSTVKEYAKDIRYFVRDGCPLSSWLTDVVAWMVKARRYEQLLPQILRLRVNAEIAHLSWLRTVLVVAAFVAFAAVSKPEMMLQAA